MRERKGQTIWRLQSGGGGSAPESPREKMRKSKKHPSPPDQTPISGRETGGNTMMDLLLDMSSQLEAMAHTLHHPMGNLGPIPKGSSEQARHDGTAGSSSTQVVAGHLESSLTIILREAEGHVPELVRRKMVRHLRQSPLLRESLSDDSEMAEEPDRGTKRRRALKSGKIRTADSTVVK